MCMIEQYRISVMYFRCFIKGIKNESISFINIMFYVNKCK